jgi:hypothetical protein
LKRLRTRRYRLLLLGLIVAFALAIGGGAYAAAQLASSGPSTSFTVQVNRKLVPGTSSVIGTVGPLTITAVCNSGSPATAEYDLTTTAAHTSMDAGPQNNDFGPGEITFWGPRSAYEANFDGGAAFSGPWEVQSLNTSLAGGANVQNSGFCVFGGTFVFSQGPL